MARRAPIIVATPLPPLKLKNIGKICPSKLARPQRQIINSELPKNVASKTGIKPFNMSPVRVRNASLLPCKRMIFVAPGFPEPLLRGSSR